MGEFKRSLLRSSDSLQIKTKRCIVFGNVVHTHRYPCFICYGKLRFVALTRNLEFVFSFFLTLPS